MAKPGGGSERPKRGRRAKPPKGRSKAALPRTPAPRASVSASPKGAVKPGQKRPTKAAKAKNGGAKPAPAEVKRFALTDEEQIGSAKYLSGTAVRRRLFEEERFLFPESYGTNRVRLLVKDPEWLFAYWDVDPQSVTRETGDLGERSAALSRLTLRITDPGNGGTSVVLVPPGSRSWYVRADTARRSYRAEVGLTLPSGEFRSLALSNVVVMPRVGPSSERVSRKVKFREAGTLSQETALGAGAPALPVAPGPWVAPAQKDQVKSDGPPAERGGASDVFSR
jgi:hypothetical protein